MTREITYRCRASRRRWRALVTALALLTALAALAAGPGSAGAAGVKSGNYSGSTTQEAVSGSFRTLSFTVKKGKVTLTAEPSVGLGLCVSAPVFTLDGPLTTKRKGRSFTFSQTFFGTQIDKIHGKFVSSTEVEGYAVYHFFAQDLCSAGKSKVTFTAKRA